MGLTSPYRQHNYIGEYANDASAIAAILGFKWDSFGTGLGVPQVGQWYFNTTTDTFRVYKSTGWSELIGNAAVGSAKSFTQLVGASSSENGSIPLGLVDGNVFYTAITINSGSTSDLDMEFGDASFAGSPNILYQIGEDESALPLWDPSVDGNWSDRNSWGFSELTGGVLYWRLTNDGVGSINVTVTVKATGYSSALTP